MSEQDKDDEDIVNHALFRLLEYKATWVPEKILSLTCYLIILLKIIHSFAHS